MMWLGARINKGIERCICSLWRMPNTESLPQLEGGPLPLSSPYSSARILEGLG